MSRHLSSLLILVALAPLPAVAQPWQVNQPGASLDVDGLSNDGFVGPIAAALFPGSSHTLGIGGSAGQPFEIFVTTVPGVPGLVTTPGGQVVNIDFTHGSFAAVYGSPLPAMGPAPVAFPFVTPAVWSLALQMLVADPGAADGFVLSALVEIVAPPPGLYVDGDFTGSFQSGTFSNPYTTISQATAAAAPGDVIHVDWSAAPYMEKVLLGTDGVTLIGDNWNQPGMPKPVLMAPPGPASGITVFVDSGVSDVTIERLEVHMGVYDFYPWPDTFTWGCALYIADAVTDTVVRNCRITGSNTYTQSLGWGMVVDWMTFDITVENCEFSDLDHWVDPGEVQTKSCLPLELYGVTNAVVQNCEFTRIGESNDLFWLDHFSRVMRIIDCQNVTVTNNLFHDITWPAVRWSQALNQPDPSGTPSPAMTLCDTWLIECWGTDVLQVFNNTLTTTDMSQCQNYQQQLRGIDFNDCTNVDARNNILSHLTHAGGTGLLPSAVQADFGISPPLIQTYSCVDASWMTRYLGGITEGFGGINADPMFVNLAAEDYHLAPGSPCIDAGDPNLLDADGTISDMGCYGGPRGALPVGVY